MDIKGYLKIEEKVPYFYFKRGKDREIVFWGSRHTRDPEHPQFEKLKKEWNEFIKRNNNEKCVAIVEFETPPVGKENFNSSVKTYGEAGALAFLASGNSIPLMVGEPSQREVINNLLNKFKKDEVLLFYMINAIYFWNKNKHNLLAQTSLDEFLQKQDKKYNKILGWPELHITLDFVKKIFKQKIGKELDVNDFESLDFLTDPNQEGTIVNEYSRAQSNYRNQHLLNLIKKDWAEGKSIFVLYGVGHAVALEESITELVHGT